MFRNQNVDRVLTEKWVSGLSPELTAPGAQRPSGRNSGLRRQAHIWHPVLYHSAGNVTDLLPAHQGTTRGSGLSLNGLRPGPLEAHGRGGMAARSSGRMAQSGLCQKEGGDDGLWCTSGRHHGLYAARTSFSKSGWRSSILSSLTRANGGLVLPFS